MNYFYATRRDKSGRKLVTSYGKEAQAEKYGGSSAVVTNKNFYLSEDGTPTETRTDLILRSKVETNPQDQHTTEGNYVLYSEQSGKFIATPHRFDAYGKANNAMKSLAEVFGTMLVVEERSNNFPHVNEEVEEEIDVGAPF